VAVSISVSSAEGVDIEILQIRGTLVMRIALSFLSRLIQVVPQRVETLAHRSWFGKITIEGETWRSICYSDDVHESAAVCSYHGLRAFRNPSNSTQQIMASAPSTEDEPPRNGNRAAVVVGWMHEHFLWLLVGCYLLAAVVPGPGLMLRQFSWGHSDSGEITVPVLLLTLLLFCAAAVVRWEQVWHLMERPGILVIALIATWLVPCMFVTVLGGSLPRFFASEATSELLVGLALVAAMPVANSSVAWTQNSRGNVALGLGLIVLTIVISPIATPQMLKLMGLALSDEATEQCEELVKRFSGAFFIVWVILPSLAGMLFNRLVGAEGIQKNRGAIRLVSAIALLALNYTNASLAMPQVFERAAFTMIALASLLAISLQLLGVVTAWVMSRVIKLDKESTIALVFAFSMKHTGVALVLAGVVLESKPRVVLLIVMATLLQHILAAIVDWTIARMKPAT
jgi:BASS family bile acid:Na+ symporter